MAHTYSDRPLNSLPNEIQRVVNNEHFEFVQHVRGEVDTDLFRDPLGRIMVLQFFEERLQADIILRPDEVAAIADFS